MIKIIINPSLHGDFITRIDNKLDIVKLWMKTLQVFYAYKGITNNSSGLSINEVEICVNDGRIYYKSQDSIFSVCFPFGIILKECALDYFSHKDCKNITNAIISFVISIIDTPQFDFHDFNKLHEVITTPDEDFNFPPGSIHIWEFISHLFLVDDGYIRYDYDIPRKKGNIHPLHHFDIFYQHKATFKIGLYNKVNVEDFCDILNKDSECYFLKKV